MRFRSFKAEIFFTIPVNGLVIGLVCAAVVTQEWVTGSLSYRSLSSPNATEVSQEESEFNFGLWAGKKTVWFASVVKYSEIKIACNSGRCMYSCAEEGGDREEDVEDALSNCPLSNVEGDLVYCEGKEVTTDEDKCGFQNSEDLMRQWTWTMTILFLVVGVIFTVVSSIFGVMNAFSNPISTILSVYGLVLWNGIAACIYFFPLVIFAAEFRSTINKAAPISQVVRGGDSVEFSSYQDTKLGFSYWLLLLALLLHLINVGLALWYIFGVIRRKQKIVKINYEAGPDNVILF